MSSRQAALLVHALGETDKAWVLAQLPTAQQQHMRSLLDELSELGIPEDRRLIDDALLKRPPTSAPADDDSFVSAVAASEVARVLRGEPTAFVRKLLACKRWPWVAKVAEELALPAFLEPEDSHPPSDAFRRCATQLLADRLRQSGSAVDVQPVAPSAAHETRSWLGRWQALWRTTA